MFNDEQKAALSADLSRSVVKTRKGGGMTLSYIEGWWAIAEANRIFGFGGWTRETVDMLKCGEPEQVNGKWRVRFMSKVRITVGDIIREGTGYGSGIAGDLGDAYEGAIKEAETDAMKRALMTFGNPFGLALYDKGQSSVSNTPAGKPLAAVSETVGRKSSAQAKRDGDYESLKAEMEQISTPDELREWGIANRSRIDDLPLAFADPLRDVYANQMDALRAKLGETS